MQWGRAKETPARTLWLLAALVACACGKKAAEPGKAGTPGDKGGPAAPALPQAGLAKATLGAPDAIEPPSRDILPGMKIEDAKAKGAKAASVDYYLEWRPDIDVWIDKDAQLVSELQVTYPNKDWEALKAKWGKPTFGEDKWLGANWFASLNGCATGDSCTVTFTLSPALLLGKTIVPPLSFARLKPGMSAAQVQTEVGVPVKDRSSLSLGYILKVGADYEDDKLAAVTVGFGEEGAQWLPWLTTLWGAPTDLGEAKVWINAKDHWIVQLDAYGDLLRFMPMAPLAEVLAKSGDWSVIALAKAAFGKGKAELAALPHYDAKNDDFVMLATDLSLRAPNLALSFDDKDKVDELRVYLHADKEGAGAQVLKAVTDAWGPIVKTKQDDEEIQTISVEGFKVLVEPEADGTGVSLTIKK